MENRQVHIPQGWSEFRLADIVDYEQPYNYTVDSTEYNNDSGIPVLTAGKSFLLGYTTEHHNVYKNTPVIIFDDFTTDSKYVDFPFKVKSSAMKFLKPKFPKELDIRVLFGFIIKSKIIETGGDHKRRWISEFSKKKIVLPPYKEQTQIATILSKVDEAMSQTEQLIAKYTRIKTGLMQDLLTKGIDENGNIRSEETHEFKDSPLGRIPKEWEWSVVSDLCSDIFLGLTSKVDYVESEGFPLIRATDVNDGVLSFKNVLSISEKQHRKLTKHRKAKKGDVLITKSGTLGICALVDTDREFSIYESIIVLQPNLEKLESNYLLWLLRNKPTQDTLLGAKVGSTVGHLNIIQFRELKVAVPNPLEQRAIGNMITKVDMTLRTFKIELSKLQSLKTGLMQDLLSGKVRVNHLIKETASV
ncbi:restriction endonuclease subunit S [Jiulongibacter sp. NS-SX5]|uniref:restriction endonuclease subunit S n=1 Tax=Jiulongibacter sp. NS-SX5 TaxID=3463854 RepID=UPI004059C493